MMLFEMEAAPHCAVTDHATEPPPADCWLVFGTVIIVPPDE